MQAALSSKAAIAARPSCVAPRQVRPERQCASHRPLRAMPGRVQAWAARVEAPRQPH